MVVVKGMCSDAVADPFVQWLRVTRHVRSGCIRDSLWLLDALIVCKTRASWVIGDLINALVSDLVLRLSRS